MDEQTIIIPQNGKIRRGGGHKKRDRKIFEIIREENETVPTLREGCINDCTARLLMSSNDCQIVK